MGADSVLVNAAHRLGMSRVPGDTSEIFNRQYEGLIEYHKASADATVEGVKAGVVGASLVGNKIADAVQGKNAKKAYAEAEASGDTKGMEAVSQDYKENRQKSKERHANLGKTMYGGSGGSSGSEKKESKAETRAGDLQLYKDKLEAKRLYDKGNQYEKDKTEYEENIEKGPGKADEWLSLIHI